MIEHLALPLYMKSIKAELDDFAPSSVAIGHSVCDKNGVYLTDCLPKSVCKDIVAICNKHYYAKLRKKDKYEQGDLLFFDNVVIPPMSRPEEKAVVRNCKGDLKAIITQNYAKYLRDFRNEMEKRFDEGNYPEPICKKCQVKALIYIQHTDKGSVATYVEAVLDCLVYSGILLSKGIQTVANTDGSRVFTNDKNPRLEIFIKELTEG